MVSLTELKGYGSNTVLELVGLAADTKPTSTFKDCKISNGSKFLEMDTKKTYLFDEENTEWKEF